MESRLRAPSHRATACGLHRAPPKFAHAAPPGPMDFCASPTTTAAAVQRTQHQCNCCTFLQQKLQRLLQFLQQPPDMPWAALTATGAAASIAAVAAARPPSASALADITFQLLFHLDQQQQQQQRWKQQQQQQQQQQQ